MSEPAAVVAVKAVHTGIWFAVEAAFVYLLWTGVTGRRGRGVTVAGGIVVAESVVFVANGFRCPLTEVAVSMGADAGSVTDIYLPKWFARSLPAIHTPLLALAAWLHRDALGAGWRRLRVGQPLRASARRASASRSSSGSE